MQNNANEMAVFNTAIYVRLSKEDGDKILGAIQKNDFLGSCSVVLIK